MSEKELAQCIVKYIEQLKQLQDAVANYLTSGVDVDYTKVDYIKSTYKKLKKEIRADANYVRLLQNKMRSYDLYDLFFSPSIIEAAASGFRSPVNSQLNQIFYGSIEDAHYRLRKYKSLEDWHTIALEETR